MPPIESIGYVIAGVIAALGLSGGLVWLAYKVLQARQMPPHLPYVNDLNVLEKARGEAARRDAERQARQAAGEKAYRKELSRDPVERAREKLGRMGYRGRSSSSPGSGTGGGSSGGDDSSGPG